MVKPFALMSYHMTDISTHIRICLKLYVTWMFVRYENAHKYSLKVIFTICKYNSPKYMNITPQIC
jgi:hypothetical protein